MLCYFVVRSIGMAGSAGFALVMHLQCIGKAKPASSGFFVT